MGKTELDSAIAEVQKKFGKIIAKARDCKALTVQKIPTGLLKLDWMLKGGISRKKLTELFGPEHSFKTAMVFKMISNGQKTCTKCNKNIKDCTCKEFEGLKILYMDFEETFSIKKNGSEWATKCGVNLDDLSIIVPSSWEEGIDIIQYVVKENLFDIIFIDSLTQAPVQYVMERDTEDPTMGVKAARNAVFVSKLFQALAPGDITDIKESFKTAIIYIQQVRDVIGKQSSFQLPPTPTGGWALKHGKHISIGISSTIKLGNDGKELGQKNKPLSGRTVKFRVYKDKIDGQYLKDETFDFYLQDVKIGESNVFLGNVDELKDVMEIAIAEGFIERSGAWYQIVDTDIKLCGIENLRNFLASDNQIYSYIEDKVKKLIYGQEESHLEDQTEIEEEISNENQEKPKRKYTRRKIQE